ncbi:MAG TPA: hypothetical protein VLY86_04055 [Methanothrix sp.]|nr:hypothetical protein [Methanothrix sp.]
MRGELILILTLMLASPAWADHNAGKVGPYNISFDMNTTPNYKVIVEMPSHGITSDGVAFTRYNLSLENEDSNYFAWLVLTEYEKPMIANITANAEIVAVALQGSGADQPKFYQPLIDGKPGVLGSFRFQNEPKGVQLGQQVAKQASQEVQVVVAASYSPDGRVMEDGSYRGRLNCRIISTFPWEVTRDLLYTLHIEVPKEMLNASLNSST